MISKSYITIKSCIASENAYPMNEDDSMSIWINDEICRIARDISCKLVLNIINFGEVKVDIDMNEYLDDDYEASMLVMFEYDDSLGDADKLSECLMSDYLNREKLFDAIREYTIALNDVLKQIVIPKNENYIFKNRYFYIEFATGSTYEHAVEWLPFSYLTDMDYQVLIEEIY